MTPKDWSREIAALTPYISGTTVSFTGACSQPIPGVGTVVDGVREGVEQLGDDSVNTIVSICGLEREVDPISTLRTWRRCLREGGVLALVLRKPQTPSNSPAGEQCYSPHYLSTLMNLVGGFEIQQITDVVDGETWLLAAQRQQIAEIRMPLGVHCPEIAHAVNQSQMARAEFYFQVGTLFLQTGDLQQSEVFFKKLLELEPGNADAFFGLGMCYGTQGRWAEALNELQRSASLQPQNPEVQRWVQLAREQVQITETADEPTAMPTRTNPAATLTPQPAPPQVKTATPIAPPTPTVTPRTGGLRI